MAPSQSIEYNGQYIGHHDRLEWNGCKWLHHIMESSSINSSEVIFVAIAVFKLVER